MNEPILKRLTDGGLIARNTVLNLLGQASPLLAGLFAIPVLIGGLGVDRFGVLSLAWIVIGYFGLFDLGLGRTLTKVVAERLAAGQEQEIPALVWTGMVIMTLLGAAGALVTALASPWLVQDLLKVPRALQPETVRAFYVLALSLPLVTSSLGLRGVLMGRQLFGAVNIVRIPMSAFIFVGPLLVLPFSRSLVPVMVVLAAGRLVALVAYLFLCFRAMPALRHRFELRRSEAGSLINFGSWVTAGTITGAALGTMDRLLVGVMVSTAAVAYYATPHVMITKLSIVPSALVEVLFSAFSASFSQDRERTALLFGWGIKYVFLALFPVTLVVVTLAPEGLGLWLGDEFAQESTRALQWLAIGVLVNSVALIPWTMLQSGGRPDLAAKLNFVELPLYALLLWWLIGAYGIEGAGIAWAIRALADAIALFVMMRRFLPTARSVINRAAPVMAATLLVLTFAMVLDGLAAKGLFLLLTTGAFVLASWSLILTSEERTHVAKAFGRIRQYVMPGPRK